MKRPPKPKRAGFLCGTDFSIHAGEAGNAAAALSVRLKEKLELVHVEEFGGLGGDHPEIFVRARREARELLARESTRLRKRGAEVSASILSGSPHQAIVKAAADIRPRCIIVASLGRIAVGPMLAGSVAERIAETAPVTTLVVRRSGPLVEWAEGRRRLKVLVGYDFSSTADAALVWTRELAHIGGCDVIVAHANWPPEAVRRIGFRGPLPLVENPPEVERVLLRELKAKSDAVFGGKSVFLRVTSAWGRPDAELLNLARQEHVDLVVVGTHQRQGLGRFWLGSVSRSVLHHAPMNVAVVPAPAMDGAESTLPPEFKRVLVSTDFSDLGDRAIPYAFAAAAAGSVVKLIHVIPPWELPGPFPPHYQPKRPSRTQHRKLAAATLKKLRSLVPRAVEHGVTVETEVLEHDAPAQAICEEAERFGADVICLGSHGRTGLSRVLLGSVAQKVLSRSQRPLLIVRPPP